MLQGSFAAFGSSAEAMAASRLAGMVRREALVMSFADVFLVLTVLFVALVAMSALIAKPNAGVKADAH